VDYDRLSRKQAITVFDEERNALSEERVISDFEKGAYITFSVKGRDGR
jgi:hypothetical protein